MRGQIKISKETAYKSLNVHPRSHIVPYGPCLLFSGLFSVCFARSRRTGSSFPFLSPDRCRRTLIYFNSRHTVAGIDNMSKEVIAFVVPEVPDSIIGVTRTSRPLACPLRRKGRHIVIINACQLIVIEKKLNDLARFRDIREVFVANNNILNLKTAS